MKKLALAAACVLGLAIGSDASAFCGFYVSGADAKLFNNATQVVLMREGTRTVLSMQNSYQGPPSNFAMVVPVPVVLQKENVKTLPKEVFSRIDQLSAPRLVEYWEQDPCPPPQPSYRGAPSGGGPVPKAAMAPAQDEKRKDLGVKIEAKFTVGEYEVVILSARDSTGLDTWLRQEKYKIPDGAEPYLKPYVQAGSKFFVAKVDVSKVKFEKKDTPRGDVSVAMLSPLRFHYDAETFSLPVRLGLMNSGGTQDLIVHILGNGKRYEVTNYPNTTIPTNFDVSEGAKTQFGAFYAALFDRTLEKIPKAIVTEYSWDAGSCDPCPSPPLDASELAVLGADVLTPSEQGRDSDESSMASSFNFVLTRLHARYGKESLGEDLVFRAAKPIVGGREFMGENGKLEHGAREDSSNNFQGRYAVRHPWTGPIACKNPQRGVWGGPPNGNAVPPTPAKDIAFAPRGKMQLATIVKGALPEVVRLPGAVEPLGSPVVRVGPAPTPLPTSTGNASSGGTTSATPEPKRGCGCDVVGGDAATGGAIIAAIGVLIAGLRRRRTSC